MKRIGLSFSILLAWLSPASAQVTNIPCNQLPALYGDSSSGSCGQVGTWTPTLVGSGTAGTFTYTNQVSSYEKIGRLVIARFGLSISATPGSPTGNMQIAGLPFTSNATPNDDGHCFISVMTGITLDAGYTVLTGLIGVSTTTILLIELGSGQTGQAVPVGKFSATTTALFGFCVYHT